MSSLNGRITRLESKPDTSKTQWLSVAQDADNPAVFRDATGIEYGADDIHGAGAPGVLVIYTDSSYLPPGIGKPAVYLPANGRQRPFAFPEKRL